MPTPLGPHTTTGRRSGSCAQTLSERSGIHTLGHPARWSRLPARLLLCDASESTVLRQKAPATRPELMPIPTTRAENLAYAHVLGCPSGRVGEAEGWVADAARTISTLLGTKQTPFRRAGCPGFRK